MPNAELYLKEAAKELSTVVYGLQPLAARLLELVSKLERLDCFHWSTLSKGEYQSKLQLITRQVSDDTKLSRFTSLR